jgi:DNA processing protein
VEDILSEFEYLFPPSTRNTTPTATGEFPTLTLSENESRVYEVLSSERLSIDKVIQGTGLSSPTVSVTLFSLEMKRLIRQLPGKIFVRNSS